MGVRNRNRWVPDDAFSISAEARGEPVRDLAGPIPVRTWLQTKDRGLVRVEARALAMTPDAVLVEWGFGQAARSAWVWRAAVKHRATS